MDHYPIIPSCLIRTLSLSLSLSPKVAALIAPLCRELYERVDVYIEEGMALLSHQFGLKENVSVEALAEQVCVCVCAYMRLY